MLLLMADEGFNNDIVVGLREEDSTIDIVTVQEVGLRGADDPTILEWAAKNNRILLTRDAKTMTRIAYERALQGLPMPGVVEVSNKVPLRQAIEDIQLLVGASAANEWKGQVVYLPLR